MLHIVCIALYQPYREEGYATFLQMERNAQRVPRYEPGPEIMATSEEDSAECLLGKRARELLMTIMNEQRHVGWVPGP